MKKCILVYNPESGKKTIFTSPFKIYEEILHKYGYEPTLIATKKKGDAIKIVENIDHADLLIVAGGDGTINEGITGNLNRKQPLLFAALPSGTMNDVGSMLGYGSNPKKNIEMLLNGVEKNIDVVLLNGQPFIYVACLGKFVDVSYSTPRELKKNFGKLAYILYGLQEVGKDLKFYDINYKIDGIEYMGKYSFIFISNSTRIAGVNNVYPNVKLDDNMFEVALCNIKSKPDLIRSVGLALTQGVSNVPGITLYKTDNFEIEFNGPFDGSWCIDGEQLIDSSPKYQFTISKKMNMLLPSVNVKKLFEKK